MAYVAATDKDELLSTLDAYTRVVSVCWPELHRDLARRRARFPLMDAATLARELSHLLDESDSSPLGVRIFWKLTPSYAFRGVNLNCARDAGLMAIEELVGLTDFSPQVPWNRQAAHYRKDDESVVQQRTEKLNIVERQDQPTGTTFLRTAKVPIFGADGDVIGLLGGYQTIDKATAVKLTRGR